MTEKDKRRTAAALPETVDPYAGQLPDPGWFPPPHDLAPASRLSSRGWTRRPTPEPGPEEPMPARRPVRVHKTAMQPDAETFQRRREPRALSYLLAGLGAMILGGGAGIAFNHWKTHAVVNGDLPPIVADATPVVPTLPKSNTTTAIKKVESSAKLEVADIRGGLNTLIPMLLSAEPGTGGEDLILRISGLPPTAYLTAGQRFGRTDWQIAAGEARGVKLVVTEARAPRIDLSVAAIEKDTGRLAAPVKEFQVAITEPGIRISPANAPPEGTEGHAKALPQPGSTMPRPSPDVERLVAKGDILLKAGDIDMARQFYERAYAEGSAAAALGAGKTYDPVVYEELKVIGLKPDPQQALAWYLRAKAAGNREAEAAIAALDKTAP
jgi:hypothetical protein